jgi:hypothetical protein
MWLIMLWLVLPWACGEEGKCACGGMTRSQEERAAIRDATGASLPNTVSLL